jgi:hypothetical protein
MLNTLRQRSRDLIEELEATGTDASEARIVSRFASFRSRRRRIVLYDASTSRGLDSTSRPIIAASEALLDVARQWSRQRANV